MERIIGKKKKKQFLMIVIICRYRLRFRDTKSNVLNRSKGKKVITKLFTSLTNVYVWLILLQEIFKDLFMSS